MLRAPHQFEGSRQAGKKKAAFTQKQLEFNTGGILITLKQT